MAEQSPGPSTSRRPGGTSQPGPSAALTALIPRLAEVCGPDTVITDPTRLRTYECDGLTGHRLLPGLVVLPETTEEVAARRAGLRARPGCRSWRAARAPACPAARSRRADGVLIVIARMRRILDDRPADRRVIVEPGVTNLDISRGGGAVRLLLRARSVEPEGLHDRRQRRRELRRRALPEVRLHRPTT